MGPIELLLVSSGLLLGPSGILMGPSGLLMGPSAHLLGPSGSYWVLVDSYLLPTGTPIGF